MLHEFLTLHRDEIIARTRAKVASRTIPPVTEAELEHGVPLFLSQLADTLRTEQDTKARPTSSAMTRSASLHGSELQKAGFTVGQVVHDYGDVCQAVTALAMELQSPISADEFKTLNRCLDDAIAQAVTEFSRVRDAASPSTRETEHQGYVTHEIRNLVNKSIIAYEVLKNGTVGMGGSTGALLGRSLFGLRDMVARSEAEVRLDAGIVRRQPVPLAELVEEASHIAAVEAFSRGHRLTVLPVDQGVMVDVDQQLVAAAITNLLQNAFKFTPRGGEVVLRTDSSTVPGRVLVSVEDECGGLPPGDAEAMFRPFEQRGGDRSGLGLGLAIVRRSVAAHGGEVHVRDVPGKGCVFTIDLPRVAVPAAATVGEDRTRHASAARRDRDPA